MAKIALIVVLISMIMFVSIHSVFSDAKTEAASKADNKGAAAPTPDATGKGGDKGKDSSWSGWAKKKMSGIGSIFGGSSAAKGPVSGPAEAPKAAALATATDATAKKDDKTAKKN